MNTSHAVYANCRTSKGATLTFRIGQPVDWHTAQARWMRLDDRRLGIGKRARRCIVKWARRAYVVESFEVRAVDYNGRGLGAERHALAFPVPYRVCRTAA